MISLEVYFFIIKKMQTLLPNFNEIYLESEVWFNKIINSGKNCD